MHTLICVAWSNGRWRVTESGPRNSIACFGERQDAMDYAKVLADTTPDSSLVVRRHEQEPEPEQNFVPRAARARLPGGRLTFRS
jgi:hypothetical protein